MTNDNWIRHLKVIGKLAFMHDTAGTNVTAENLAIATTADQIATALVIDNPTVELFGQNVASLLNAVTSGSSRIQEICVTLAAQYMALPLFTSSMTTVSTSLSAADLVTALITEMGLTTTAWLTPTAATGIANFLNIVSGSVQTWPSSGTHQYEDSVYAISEVV